MIKIHLSSDNKAQLEEIVVYLIKEKLVIDVNFDTEIARLVLEDDKLVYKPFFLVTAKTKAMLFNDIENFLVGLYGENVPELYSMPIVNMKWSQAKMIAESIQKI